MIIYVKEKENINKYNVEFDSDELSKLRIESINNCSTIIHHEENSVWGPSDRDILKIRNLERSSKPVGVHEYNDAADENVYHYSYDEYVYPQLVDIIDGLLFGDIRALNMLYNDVVLDAKDYDGYIRMALKRFENADSIEEKKSILNKINECLEEKSLNANRKPIDEYYTKVKNLISYLFIDSIKVSDIQSVMIFFDNDLSNNDKVIDEKQIKLVK